MKSLKSFIIFVFVIISIEVKAQFLHIEALSVPSYVYEGSPVSMSFKIKNTGFSPYSGTMVVYMAEQFYDFPKDIYAVTINLNPNDSIQIDPSNVVFQNFFFQYGNNIVVVWPKGIGVPNDSVSFPLYMDYSLLVNEYTNESLILYPNPVIDELNIIYSNLNNPIERVRIVNMFGRCVYENSDYKIINTINFSSGFYNIHITLKNGTTLYGKILKI